MKDANDTATREIIPQKIERRGGWREGAGRKKGEIQTRVMRVDERLIGIMETLREKLRSGAIDEKTIEKLTESVMT